MHTWSSIAANEIITRAELDAAITASIFVRKSTFTIDNKCVTKAEANSYIYLDASNTFYSPKTSNQLIAKRDLTACNSTPNFVSQAYTTCSSCIDYTVFKDINVCSSTYNHYMVNGVDVGTAPPTGLPCSTSPNYSTAIGTLCTGCTNYTVYQNINPCFTGNQYYANGTSYINNPSTGICNTTTPVFPPYYDTIGIYCDTTYCTNIPVSQNINACYTGPNQYTIGNDIYFSTNPVTGNCNTSPSWTINVGTICSLCGNYFVYQNSNPCYTGNQYFTYATGLTYASNPATGACSVSPNYSNPIGILCSGCIEYIVYQNTNPCFGGNQYYSNGTEYSYNPSNGSCNYSPSYTNSIGQKCVGCTTYTVYQNTNTCFTGNQYYYNGTSYSSNPSTGACNTSANYGLDGSGYIGITCAGNCQEYPVYINLNGCFTGNQYYYNGTSYATVQYGLGGCDNNPIYTSQSYYTCYNCQRLLVYRDTQRCNSTAGKYFVYTNQWVNLGSAPANADCNTTPNYESQGYVTCISCVDYLVYKDTRECSSTFNHYFRFNGSSYDDLGTSAPSSGYCSCCTEYAVTNYSTYTSEYIEWTDCYNTTHSYYLNYPETIYICRKEGTSFTYGSVSLSTIGSCNY